MLVLVANRPKESLRSLLFIEFASVSVFLSRFPYCVPLAELPAVVCMVYGSISSHHQMEWSQVKPKVDADKQDGINPTNMRCCLHTVLSHMVSHMLHHVTCPRLLLLHVPPPRVAASSPPG